MRGCRLLIWLCLVGVMAPLSMGQSLYWPDATEWESVPPEAAGFDAELLGQAADYAERFETRGLLVLRGGRIAFERYWQGWDAETVNDTYSCHLGMLGVLTQMAVERGELTGLNQPMADYIPSWRETRKAEITLRHVLTMTSGLSSSRFRIYDIDEDQVEKNARMPLTFDPGTVFRVNTPSMHLLYGVLKHASGEDIELNAQRRLFDPLEMGPVGWRKDVWHDGKRPYVNFYHPIMTVRQMGRFGLFVERGGVWKDQRLVSAAYMREATLPTKATELEDLKYGMLFSLDVGWAFQAIPRDTIVSIGYGYKLIIVAPSLDLVVVRQGGTVRDREFTEKLINMICIALERGGGIGGGRDGR